MAPPPFVARPIIPSELILYDAIYRIYVNVFFSFLSIMGVSLYYPMVLTRLHVVSQCSILGGD